MKPISGGVESRLGELDGRISAMAMNVSNSTERKANTTPWVRGSGQQAVEVRVIGRGLGLRQGLALK